jgi:hypothetical protein
VKLLLSSLLLAATAFVAFACSEYPLPPTDCDDWCFATQHGCEDDDPADCVRECEEERATREARACDAPFHVLTACYRENPSAAFACRGNVTRPIAGCQDQRRDFVACMAPGGRLCFEQCQRKATVCGSDALECEDGCLGLDPACEAAADGYHQCALAVPVECEGMSGGGADMTCFDPALVFLDCVGY